MIIDNQKISSKENKIMCEMNISRFLETARRHLLDQVTVEFAAVSAPISQAD
ncbi:MAG: hypothetical protein WBO95_02810 [Candidatus Dechloromonas phosphoritropha]|jgi:hypothetical protein